MTADGELPDSWAALLLAEALGVQKGSLYSLTGSKQELLFQTMREGARAFHASLDGVPEDASAVERVRLALRGHLRVVSEQIDVATVFTREWRYLEGELGRVLALEDAAEGIAAFLGKRKPVWKGR